MMDRSDGVSRGIGLDVGKTDVLCSQPGQETSIVRSGVPSKTDDKEPCITLLYLQGLNQLFFQGDNMILLNWTLFDPSRKNTTTSQRGK